MYASTPPDTICDPFFEQAEELAWNAEKGIWGPTPTPTQLPPTPTATLATTGQIQISYIKYRAKRWREPNEFVEIHNPGSYPIQMQGWRIKDSQNHIFTFPDFVMQPGAYCQIYTDWYEEGTCGLSFDHPTQIWDNFGECAYLYDAQGQLVDEFCYEY